MVAKSWFARNAFIGIALVLSAQAYGEYRAGTAGGPHGDIRQAGCASDEWPIGLRVGGGTYLQTIVLECAKRNNLRSVREVRVTYTASAADYLSMGNRREKTTFCPTGYALAGVKLQAGTYVDRMNSLRCQAIGGKTLKYPGVGIGGKGGSTLRLYCRRGDTVSQIRTRSGSWIDEIAVFCK